MITSACTYYRASSLDLSPSISTISAAQSGRWQNNPVSIDEVHGQSILLYAQQRPERLVLEA
jgi:hypothetical protein